MNLIVHGYGLRSASYSSLMLIDLFFKGNFMSESYPLHLMNKKPNFYGFSGLDRAAIHASMTSGLKKSYNKVMQKLSCRGGHNRWSILPYPISRALAF